MKERATPCRIKSFMNERIDTNCGAGVRDCGFGIDFAFFLWGLYV